MEANAFCLYHATRAFEYSPVCSFVEFGSKLEHMISHAGMGSSLLCLVPQLLTVKEMVLSQDGYMGLLCMVSRHIHFFNQSMRGAFQTGTFYILYETVRAS